MLTYPNRNPFFNKAGRVILLASSIAMFAPWASTAKAVTGNDSATVTVDVDNANQLKGMGCVAIASFEVDIVGHVEATADIAGIELMTGAPSDISTTLTGTDKTRYQGLVNGLYDRFASDLAGQGFKVMSQPDLAGNPDFQKLQAKDPGNPRTVNSPAGTNDYYSAYGLPIILADENVIIKRPAAWGKKAARDPYVNWTNVFGLAESVQTLNQQGGLSKSSNCSMLNVRLTMLGGQAKIEKTFWRTGASGVADGAMAYVPLYNRVLVVGPHGYEGMGRVSLKDQFTTPKLGDLVNATKGTDTAGNIAANTAVVFGRLAGIGGLKYSNTKKYEVRTNESDFETAVNTSFASVSAGLVGELARDR